MDRMNGLIDAATSAFEIMPVLMDDGDRCCAPYVELQRSPAKLRNGSYRVTPARKKICGAPHGTAPALPPFNRRPTGMQTNPVLKTLIRLPEYLLIGL